MIKEIINTEIDSRILINLLLNHQIPYAVSFMFIHIGGFSIIQIISDNGTIGIIRINIRYHIITATRQGVTIQHMNIIIAPQTTAPSASLILKIHTDIHFMTRFIQ